MKINSKNYFPLFLALLILNLLYISFGYAEQLREEVFYVKTKDNWKVALTHFFKGHQIYQEPLIFAPGFIENRYTFNFKNGHSMADYFTENGFDVWVMEYRGSGLSQAPKVNEVTKWDFSVDDFIHLDLPACVDFVLNLTKKEQVILLGHSMGGLMTYGYLETESPKKVKAAVTFAGAGFMGVNKEYGISPTLFAIKFLSVVEPIVAENFPLPMKEITKQGINMPTISLFASYLLSKELGYIFWQPLNMNQEFVEHAFKNLIDNISMNVVKQFALWTRYNDVFTYGPNPYDKIKNVSYSQFYKKHGFYSYTKNLNLISTPILVTAGAADTLISQGNARFVFDQLGSVDKTLIIFGKENGHSVDYGHEDLCFGINSPLDVYPEVLNWLVEHASLNP